MSTSTTSPRSAKLWKGAAAGAAAVALLLGGGASFAEWRDSATANSGAAITSGVLTIDSASAGTWTNVRGTDVTTAVRGGTYRVVPGDALTFTQTMNIAATGDLMSATVSTNLTELTGDAQLLAAIEESASMSLNSRPVDGLSAQVGTGRAQFLEVAITLPFDAATTDLTAQGQTVRLADLEVVLAQNTVAGS